jgi:hypothetical protein
MKNDVSGRLSSRHCLRDPAIAHQPVTDQEWLIMASMHVALCVVVLLVVPALLFDFMNGFNAADPVRTGLASQRIG